MSVTVLPVSVSTPPPAAPAAEAVDAAGGFERVLAQSEAASAPETSASRRESADAQAGPGDEPASGDGAVSDGQVLAVDVGFVTFMALPVADQPGPAPQPEGNGEAPLATVPPTGIGGTSPEIDLDPVDGPVIQGFAGSPAEEPVAPASPQQLSLPPSTDATRAATQVSAGATTTVEPRGETTPAAVALESGSDIAAPIESRGLEPSRPDARTARPVDARDPARALAAEVLAYAADSGASEAGRRSPGVATTPIQPNAVQMAPVHPQGPAAAMPTHEIEPLGTSVDPVAAGEPAPIVAPEGSGSAETGSHESFDRHAPSTARKAVEVPAQMAFPAHAAFAAAIERAQPALEPSGIAAPGREQLASVVPQVVRSVQLHLTPGGGEVTLTLQPENLGTVKIELRVDRHRVSATVAAETAAVRGWLASNEHELKSGLADLGLQLDELIVREDGRREGQSQQPDERGTPKRRRRETQDAPLFEVHV